VHEGKRRKSGKRKKSSPFYFYFLEREEGESDVIPNVLPLSVQRTAKGEKWRGTKKRGEPNRSEFCLVSLQPSDSEKEKDRGAGKRGGKREGE